MMVSTVWSVSCLLFFFYSLCLRVQPFVKVGASAPVPYGVGVNGDRIKLMKNGSEKGKKKK